VGVRLATRHGRSVDVVGFDDSPVASLLLPPLSSVRQPLEDVARAIVRLLVEQLDRGAQSAEGVLLPPQLVVRDG
jgi:DNA-binding LacI/PurR family transcriptional regulator